MGHFFMSDPVYMFLFYVQTYFLSSPTLWITLITYQGLTFLKQYGTI